MRTWLVYNMTGFQYDRLYMYLYVNLYSGLYNCILYTLFIPQQYIITLLPKIPAFKLGMKHMNKLQVTCSPNVSSVWQKCDENEYMNYN